ncbi:HEPN domain-containing protein [Thermococcus sp. LS2]|uniref:HEPN domain-containing protein n=1 Tax=Thermococcus sp. LS2 TaxID=1638260 RepID=UPI001438B647|nr:HEPN domain-containing protein [Thermococcus sp. LS2]NJE12134.1 HEPN domain-containing protein [Thermococcus sp. LS2]
MGVSRAYKLRLIQADIDLAKSAYEKGYYEMAIFHCQQAIEKSLKLLLEEKAGKYVRTHDLMFLRDLVGEFEEIRELLLDDEFLDRLEEGYFYGRYWDKPIEPFEDFEVQKAIYLAEEIFKKIKGLLG